MSSETRSGSEERSTDDPEDLRRRLEEAEETLRALVGREVDSEGERDDLVAVLLQEAREALEASEERFRALVEHSSDIIAILTPDGLVRYVSPAVRTVLGWEPDELTGRRIGDLVTTDEGESVQEALEELRRESIDQLTIDVRARHRDDGWRHLECIATDRTGIPSIDGIVLNARDVTEWKRAEEARLESAQMLEALVEASPIPIALFDRDLNTRVYNRAAEETFGWTKEEIQELGFQVAIPERLREESRQERRKVLEEGQTLSGYVVPRKRKDSSEILISFSAAPVRDARGEIGGFVAVAEDITERRELEKRLRQSQRMEAIGQLAGGIAHDFNNLLTAISGYADLAAGALDDEHPVRDDVDEIRTAAGRAAELTQQLLAYSRQQIQRSRPLDLNDVVGELEGMLGRLIGEEIRLETRLEPELWEVQGDPAQLEQVMTNLVVNARDAMPRGGTLTVLTDNVALADDRDMGAYTIDAGEYVRLRVSDTGTGMDDETRSRAFEPFFTTKSTGQGTGLGLSTVYGIVKQSRGYVTLDSEPGEGTTFDVLLPRASEPAGADGEAARDDPRTTPGLEAPARSAGRSDGEGAEEGRGDETVLLVEDNPGVRELSSRALDSAGYRTLVASDAGEARALLAEHGESVDLLVTDVVLPDERGPDLAEALRELFPALEVLYMSGYTSPEYLERKGLGRETPLLSKPYSPRELTSRVRELLDASRRRRGA